MLEHRHTEPRLNVEDLRKSFEALKNVPYRPPLYVHSPHCNAVKQHLNEACSCGAYPWFPIRKDLNCQER